MNKDLILASFTESPRGKPVTFDSRQAHSAGCSCERLSDLMTRYQFIRVRRGVYRLTHFPANRIEEFYITHLKIGPDSTNSH
jgi:hypothetical protein